MKKLFLVFVQILLVCQFTQAQVILLSEDFSSATGTTPPPGWDQQVFAGDPIVDLWSFNNPGSRILNTPLSSPAAIFDSDNYSNNSLPEDVALQSPVFSTLGQNTIFLKFDHYFRSISPSAYFVEVFDGSSWTTVLSGTASTANPQPELINVSAQVANLPNARVRFRYEGNYSWYWFVDNVEVYSTGSLDLRVMAIDSLRTSCSFGTNEQISVKIENLGTTAQGSFDLSYSINGGVPVTEPYSGPSIPAGGRGTYTFTNMEDLSAPITYNVKAYSSLIGDSNTANDTAGISFQNLGGSPLSLAYSEDFDAFSPGTSGVLANGWTNVGDYDWWASSGITPTNGTGPDGDHSSGTGLYLYTEATSRNPGDEFVLRSPCIDISAPAFLSYFYHMHGADMGSLEVFVVADGVSFRVDSIGGEQQGSSTAPWLESVINLAPFVGQTILLEFRGRIGNGAASDIALDDVSIYFPAGKDLGIAARLAPTEDVDCFGPNEEFTLLLSNSGGDTLDFSVDTTYLDLVLTGANTGIYALELDSGKIPPLQSISVSFSGVDLSNPGSTQVDASLLLPGDIQPANDLLTFNLNTLAPVALPYLENFDSFPVDTFGVFPGGWKNVSGSDRKWLANTGSTSTANTGPNGDNGPSNGVYLYTEASFPALAGDQFRLMSPCVDLTGSTSPEVSFFYHLAGNAIGRLDILVLSNGTETLVDSLVGPQQSSSFDSFLEKSVDLSGFTGMVRIEFRGIRGSGATGDIAIDDVAIRDAGIPDLSLMGASHAITPYDFGCYGNDESYLVEIKNNGSTLDFGVNPTRIIVQASGANNFTDTLILNNGTINLKEVQDFTLNGLDLSNPGSTVLHFSLENALDPSPENDSLSLEVLSQPIISTFPYKEDFESGNGGFAAAGERSTWALGDPDKAIIKGAYSGDQAWTTGGLGRNTYNSGEKSAVYSPCFDMRNAPEDLFVVLYYWTNAETDFDGAVLQASTDAGQSWQRVGELGDPSNWYQSDSIAAGPGGQSSGWTGNGAMGSNGYVQAWHALDSALIGKEEVRFRIAFAADTDFSYDGFAFDDFALAAFPKVDLGEDSLTLCIGEGLDAGNPGSTFRWSTGDTTREIIVPNVIGNSIDDSLISVEVTNIAGLSARDSIIVNIRYGFPPQLVASLVSDETCAFDSTGAVFVEVSGMSTPLTYSWSNGDSTEDLRDVSAGTYTLMVRDSLGCSFTTETFEVGYLDSLPQTPRISQVEVRGSRVRFETDSVAEGLYTWIFGDGSPPVGAQNPTHSYENNGLYVVSLTLTNGCGSTTAFDTVMMSTVGLSEGLSSGIIIYPNPNEGSFTLKAEGIEGNSLSVRICDLNGREVFVDQLPNGLSRFGKRIDLPGNLGRGIYLLEVSAGEKVFHSRLSLK